MILLFKWNKLSLTYKEGKSLSISKDKQIHEFVLVAKFLTKRNVNIDAVAKTFRPLWRMTQRFNVRDAGDNYLLFGFESESDVEKVIMGEPWSYDRHLGILHRYDRKTPLANLQLSTAMFWVQIHNLPFSMLSP